jgi:hypothetical protein
VPVREIETTHPKKKIAMTLKRSDAPEQFIFENVAWCDVKQNPIW